MQLKQCTSTKEYNRQLALWACELKIPEPLELPKRPVELVSYDEKTSLERLKLGLEFWQIPAVKKYQDERDSVCSKNYSAFCWINNVFDYLDPQSDGQQIYYCKLLKQHYSIWFDNNSRWLGIYRPGINDKLFPPDLHETIEIAQESAENEAVVMDLNEMFKE